MLKKWLYATAGLLVTAGLVWGATTLPDGTVVTPVTTYGSSGNQQAVISNTSDGVGAGTSSATSASMNYGFNLNTGNFDRIRTGASTDTSSTTTAIGILKSQLYIYNASAGNLVPWSSGSTVTDANALANTGSVAPYRWNGATWDRDRGNTEAASASLITLATTSANGSDQTNFNGRGVKCVYDITSLTGTNTILTIQGKDSSSGKYYTILASAALTTTGTTVMTVYPGLTAAANLTASDVLPRFWRLITTNTALSAFTGTVGCTTIL